MLKPQKLDIATTNIAMLGSDLEKKVKLEAAQHEQAWKGAGKVVGLDIWRVEKFKIIAVKRETYGTFYSGDSYIILHTYKPKPDAEKLSYDVHFWLGKYTSQDEAGTAAYKTVELDDFLGGAPVQYREVQGHESQRFMAIFPKGIRILEGGVDTGFKHVAPKEYKPRLLQVKGKKLVRVVEVPLAVASLNEGDVFILDKGLDIIQWNGAKSGIMERAKAAQLIQAIETERSGKAHGRVVDQSENDKEFHEGVGGAGPIASAEAGGKDDAELDIANVDKKLYRLSDASGSMTFTEVGAGKKIKKSLLTSDDVYVLDAGSEVIAWVGKASSQDEKKYALKYAQEYVAKNGKKMSTPVSRVLEGGENPTFKSLFQNV